MILSFTLSMPGRNSWNGKWTGQGRSYVRVKAFRGKKVPTPGDYGYDFGDGWMASIKVAEVDSQLARKLRAASEGFCGYDWMIDSIIRDGDIYGPTQPKPKTEKPM